MADREGLEAGPVIADSDPPGIAPRFLFVAAKTAVNGLFVLAIVLAHLVTGRILSGLSDGAIAVLQIVFSGVLIGILNLGMAIAAQRRRTQPIQRKIDRTRFSSRFLFDHTPFLIGIGLLSIAFLSIDDTVSALLTYIFLVELSSDRIDEFLIGSFDARRTAT